MSQDGSNVDKKSAQHDRAIAAAVIGAMAVIGAALITVFLSRGGGSGANPAVGATSSQHTADPHSLSPTPAPSSTGSVSTPSPVCASGSLQLIGSTAFVPIAQEAASAYRQACPDATITVTGGDSAYGVTQVRDAVASRSKSAGSMIAMYDGVSTDTAGLRPYPIGVLIFSVVAHTHLFPASDITTGELRTIFVQLGEQDKVAVGRRAGSGSRKAFFANVLNPNPVPPPYTRNCPRPTGSTFPHASCTEDSTADLLNFVNGTPNAIGYAEVYGPLTGYPQVSVIAIDNAMPTAENVRNRSYSFWTVEHLYAATQPTTLAKDFLDFLPHYIESNPAPDLIACSDAPRLVADC